MSAPVPEVDAALVKVLAAHRPVFESDGDYGEMQWVECTCGSEYFVDTDADEATHRAHLARAVQGYVEGRVAAGVAELLSGDTVRLKVRMALLSRIGPDLGVDKTLATAASAIALEVIREHATAPQTASTPDGGCDL